MHPIQTFVQQQNQFDLAKIAAIKKELHTLPKGIIIPRKNYLYQRHQGKERAITKNIQLQKELVRRAFLTEQLKRLEHNINCKTPSQYKSTDFEEIRSALSKTIQKMPKDYFFAGNEEIRGSENTGYYPERLQYMTSSGILVRSKSERFIADTLSQYQLCYHYEQRVVIGGKIMFPDFRIPHPMTKKLFYWEHWGMTDDEDYLSQMEEKLPAYCREKIFPGKNLICSYESDLRNPQNLHRMIQQYFFS